MTCKKHSIAIIGAGEMARVFALKAREMGIITHCFAWEKGAIAKEYVSHFYPVSIFEKERILDICTRKNINGIVSTTELTIPIVAYISEKLGLNGNNYELSQNITNKKWVREKTNSCKNFHHPCYQYVIGECQYDAKKWSNFPAIVKPTSEGGKRGVVVVNTPEELCEAINYAKSFDKRHNGVLIEEFLLGRDEYSVEGLSYNGEHQIIQITEKISSGPPHCVELGHHQPANISEELKEKVKLAVIELLDLVGFYNGPTHTEIKIINGRIYLIELNARPGGDHIAATLTNLSTGYDYIGEIIRVCMNLCPRKANHENKKYAGVYFVTKQTAFLKPYFDTCDDEEWLYKKHIESEELEELNHNDGYHTNYIIYYSNKRISFEDNLGSHY